MGGHRHHLSLLGTQGIVSLPWTVIRLLWARHVANANITPGTAGPHQYFDPLSERLTSDLKQTDSNLVKPA